MTLECYRGDGCSSYEKWLECEPELFTKRAEKHDQCIYSVLDREAVCLVGEWNV